MCVSNSNAWHTVKHGGGGGKEEEEQKSKARKLNLKYIIHKQSIILGKNISNSTKIHWP